MIDKAKLKEIYSKGATISDMKIIMEDIVKYMQDNELTGMCWEFANFTYVILHEYGFKPALCLGLYDWSKSTSSEPLIHKTSHAWIEVNGMILDIAIALQKCVALAGDDSEQQLIESDIVIHNDPVLFEPSHKRVYKPYLLDIADKFWLTKEGKFAASWLSHCAMHGPGTICNLKNSGEFIALLNTYLPYDVTNDYIREKYCNDNTIMTAPMKVIPFIFDNQKWIFK